jgi:hypothetical protein
LVEAGRRYEMLPAPTGPEGVARVQELRNETAKDKQDGEEPDAADDLLDVSIPIGPTHVNSEILQVFKELGGGGATAQELRPFTTVTILNTEQDWSLIAKDGKQLGYVAAMKLHKLD